MTNKQIILHNILVLQLNSNNRKISNCCQMTVIQVYKKTKQKKIIMCPNPQ